MTNVRNLPVGVEVGHFFIRLEDSKAYSEFLIMDFEMLSFSEKSFNCVIAIDSLYEDCVNNLEALISHLKAILKPNGRMGILYTENKDNFSDASITLESSNTKLTQVLKSQMLPFATIEFTNQEQELLERKLSELETLKEFFRSENNYDIFKKIKKHSRKLLQRIINGNSRRYLYHIQK